MEKRANPQPQHALMPPIFIVGCGHSGTSILLNILGMHSNIYAIPSETNFAYKLPENGAETDLTVSRWNSITKSMGKKRWLEKTPRHIHRLPQILSHFPEGKVLIMIRDGRDVACSMQDRFGNLLRGINRWVKDNREGEKHWNHPNVLCVRYEELVKNPEATLAAIMSFLEESPERTQLEYYRQPKFYYHSEISKPPNGRGENHLMFRNWQINQPLFDGRGKWTRMTAEEKMLVKAKAGEMLIQYKYTTNLNW